MKHFQLLLSVLLSTACVRAQNTDFAPVGARWTYRELNFALKVVPYTQEAVGKEFYQGKWCSRIEPVSPSVGFSQYVYTENDTVYYYSNNSNQFEMLYDFTAEEGDQWVVGGLAGAIPDNPLPYASDTITVEYVSHIVVGGDTLKVWHIKNSFWFSWGDRIIEKVGNDKIFKPQFGLVETYIWGLRCFESPDYAYQFVPYPCDTVYSTINGTQNLNPSTHLAVTPNPATEFIQLPWDGPLESLQLFDALGRQISSGKFHLANGLLEVPVGHLSTGMYFLSLRAQGQVWGGRFVKD